MLKDFVKISEILKEIKESGVKDARGNVVIQPGLKVRHKKSGLEYSVQNVETDDGKIKIALGVPELPRVNPTKTTTSVMNEDEAGQDLDSLIDKIDASQETVFVVDEKDFEKEYEVK